MPQEWPLARLSVQLRHVGLLRVTLHRRLAELSFRNVPFNLLPRELVREVRRDFDVICGATARQLASLFVFLRPEQTENKQPDPTELALCADPDFWRYGLLSFGAKTCEAKTVEARGIQAFRPRDENATPALESNRNALSLMQTVVMSFGRNLCLSKPDLPICHLHVYLPVQLIHKLVERMGVLRFRDVTPEEGKTPKMSL